MCSEHDAATDTEFETSAFETTVVASRLSLSTHKFNVDQ